MSAPLGMFSRSPNGWPRWAPSTFQHKQRRKDPSRCHYLLVQGVKASLVCPPAQTSPLISFSAKNIPHCFMSFDNSKQLLLLNLTIIWLWELECRNRKKCRIMFHFRYNLVMNHNILLEILQYEKIRQAKSLCKEFSSLMCLYWITALLLTWL